MRSHYYYLYFLIENSFYSYYMNSMQHMYTFYLINYYKQFVSVAVAIDLIVHHIWDILHGKPRMIGSYRTNSNSH